jgi:hypothetical protein
VKKWWIGVLVFLLLVALIFWGSRPSHAITVATYGGFQVYNIEYFSRTNRIYYWRCAWRDALCLVGLQGARARSQSSQHGPALVIYHSSLAGHLALEIGGSNAVNRSIDEYFGDRIVAKYFFEAGPMANGVYHLGTFTGRGWTNLADITINFKN